MQTKIKLYPSIKMLETNEFKPNDQFNWNQPFVLEEKVDGSNISLIKYQDQLWAFSRNQLIEPSAFKDFGTFLKQWGNLLKAKMANGEVLNGEYIQQGRIKYELDQLDQQMPFVLFDYGQVAPQWLAYIFNDGIEPDASVAKINFYPLEHLQATFADLPFKKTRLEQLAIEPVFADGSLNDLLINWKGQKLRWSDQMEPVLQSEFFHHHSAIFQQTPTVEGVILKSADGKMRLKYVFQAWKNLRQSRKGHKNNPVLNDAKLNQFLKTAVLDRWEKFNDYLYWNDEAENVFRGQSNISGQIKKQPELMGRLLKYQDWFWSDIMSELGPQSSFDQYFLKNHRQQIMQIIQRLIKEQVQEQTQHYERLKQR